MKKLFIFIALLFVISPTPAHAAAHSTYLATIANRNYAGAITNLNFEKSLDPSGDLGKLVFDPIAKPRTWVIDAALIEDVQSLADKKSVSATNWLLRLKQIVRYDTVYSTAYGNPDVIYLQSLAPAELTYYYKVGQEHLQLLLGKSVMSEKGSGFSWKRAKISSDVREFLNSSREDLIALNTVVGLPEIESDRAKIAQLFNSQLTDSQRAALLTDFQSGEASVISKLKIVNGRYQITTANEKIPVTLVNDFDTSVKVDLLFTPLNNRVVFPEYRQISLNPKSKIQISIPIKSITSGETTVMARFENGKGVVVGEQGIIDISSTIISPAVTKFTTGAGVLLILAAIAQSVRRVRKNRAAK